MTLPARAADPDAVRGSLTALIVLFTCYTSLSVIGVVLAKRWLTVAAVDVRSGNLLTGAVGGAAAGATAYAVSFVFWLVISTRAPLSVAYPVAVGVTSVLTIIAGALVFGERPSALQLLGSVVVLAGVGVLTSGLRR